MKKIISIFAILAMSMALLTACGSSGKVLAFNLLSDDTYEVSISVDPLLVKGKVNIPSQYKGKAVTRIAHNAFKDCKNLSAITIPETINHVGADAFRNTGIWNESKADSVIYLGNWVIGYKGDRNTLTSLSIEPGTIGIAANAFPDQDVLESVSIPDSVTTIGGRAFANCDSLKSVIIPASVTVMEYAAFSVPYPYYGEESEAELMILIYVRASSKPAGWADNWVIDDHPHREDAFTVVWGYQG